eukprot:3835868-Amphidinium_carterae.1
MEKARCHDTLTLQAKMMRALWLKSPSYISILIDSVVLELWGGGGGTILWCQLHAGTAVPRCNSSPQKI